jgi:hypothetical protein
MRLYDVPVNSKIKIDDTVLNFKHLDGMYSLCYTEDGKPVHPACFTKCEVIEEEE